MGLYTGVVVWLDPPSPHLDFSQILGSKVKMGAFNPFVTVPGPLKIIIKLHQGVVTAMCPVLPSATAIKIFDHQNSVLIA